MYYSTLVSGNIKLCRSGEQQTLQLSREREARFHYQRPGKWKLDTYMWRNLCVHKRYVFRL